LFFFLWRFYGRFLTAISIRAPTMTIAIMIAITPAAIYMSVGGKVATVAGDLFVSYSNQIINSKKSCHNDGYISTQYVSSYRNTSCQMAFLRS
jgi:hypothetical protein